MKTLLPRDGFQDACKIVCATDGKGGGEIEWVIYLPERLLWSPEGMAELFRLCRGWLRNPQEFPDDEAVDTVWEFFHIVSIKPVKRIQILDVAWEEPDRKEEANS